MTTIEWVWYSAAVEVPATGKDQTDSSINVIARNSELDNFQIVFYSTSNGKPKWVDANTYEEVSADAIYVWAYIPTISMLLPKLNVVPPPYWASKI